MEPESVVAADGADCATECQLKKMALMKMALQRTQEHVPLNILWRHLRLNKWMMTRNR
ncbi:unnamed protein product [Arabis nemorensis]|uniref:Uncharacterized protein n=1 Tax=Arabis nemorensis TaxID=586526 RepID=A0A565C5P4_9BRAS|nr:unnamed protein product [Arabis nemorensis]